MTVLPFHTTCTIEQGGTTVASDVPISVWTVGRNVAEGGAHYDHAAECPREFYDQLIGASNVRLVMGGSRYFVVEATDNEFLPHVSLRLNRSRASG